MVGLLRHPAAIGALLVLATFVVYAPAVDSQLVADDFLLVSISFREAATYWHETFGLGRSEYRPLTALSYAIDNALWNDDPRGYHFTNIALHAIVVVLLFLWARSLSGCTTVGIVAALFFLVHPINHSRANWIAARDGVLSGVFCLLCLWAYLRHREASQPVRKHSSFSLTMLAGSLLSYEGAVALPLLLGATDLFSTSGPVWTRERVADVFHGLRPYLLVLAVYLIFWNVLFGGSLGAYDLAADPLSVASNFGRLLYSLAHGHNRWPGLLYLLLLILAFRTFREQRNLVWLSGLIVVLSYLPFCLLQGFAQRFGYSSALGYSLLLALLLFGAAQGSARWRPLVAGGLGLGLLAYQAVEARARIFEWREAGDIAASIPRQLKRMHPTFPKGASVVFGGIPRMHRRAQVFPLGVQGAIEREYAEIRLRVESDERPLREWAPPPSSEKDYYFEYRAPHLVEIQQSALRGN